MMNELELYKKTVKEYKEMLINIIKLLHYGGRNGGLSEFECRFEHDALLTRLGLVNDPPSSRHG